MNTFFDRLNNGVLAFNAYLPVARFELWIDDRRVANTIVTSAKATVNRNTEFLTIELVGHNAEYNVHLRADRIQVGRKSVTGVCGESDQTICKISVP